MAQAELNTLPKLVIRKVIRAPREKVYEAWTNPALMEQWLVPPDGWTARARNEPKVGGTFQQEMIVGQDPACSHGFKPGDVLLHSGEYLELLPPERLVFTWNSHHAIETRVTVELKDLGGQTELWLTHELLDSEENRQAHSQGWEAALVKLDRLLAGS